ncbi:uncharacterized protein EHS24_006032 [Apiotrichum porosum]|uniref:Uncharacterized protein n=1 Tax=Apiotrichum porosum TaxID=105984 RepID=A0A427Y0E4_9TREE|nr:uncharacterized protein EHS24_006032 [Apiotrichum porosum]RSH84510.1 hypothetical protein EHS24_006032 [Apiotrichum porosum]
MRENVYQHFKFSRRATRLVAFYGIIFPATIYGLSALYDNKFDWAGKTRNESLLRTPPAAPAADEE